MLIHFFQSTWFLWWIFAIVSIVRWFNTVSAANQDWEETTEFVFEREDHKPSISRPLGTN